MPSTLTDADLAERNTCLKKRASQLLESAADRAFGAQRFRAVGRRFGRTGGLAAGPILNDSTTIFIDFHKKHPKTLCFSVVSRPAEAQVPIFTGQMKKASKKH